MAAPKVGQKAIMLSHKNRISVKCLICLNIQLEATINLLGKRVGPKAEKKADPRVPMRVGLMASH